MSANARSRVSNSRARKSRVPEGGSNCVGMRPMLPDRAGSRHIGFPAAVTGAWPTGHWHTRMPVLPWVDAPKLRAATATERPQPEEQFLSPHQASDGPPAAMPGTRRPAAAGPEAPPVPPRYALWLAIGLQAVISAGDGLVLVALASRVYQGSHTWAVAAVFLAVTIPITALAPLAGLLLDRLPARPVLIAAAAVQAVTALALTQVPGIGPVLALATGFGVGAAVLQPGLGAIVPRLVGPAGQPGQLLAVGLTAAGGTGPALAGVAVIYALGTAGLCVLPLAPRPQDGTAGA